MSPEKDDSEDCCVLTVASGRWRGIYRLRECHATNDRHYIEYTNYTILRIKLHNYLIS